MKKPIIDPCSHCLTKPLCDKERELLCEDREYYHQLKFAYAERKTNRLQLYSYGIIILIYAFVVLLNEVDF